MIIDPTGMAQRIVHAAVEAESRTNSDYTPGPRFQFDRGKAEAKYRALVEPMFNKFTGIPDSHSYDGVINDLAYAMHYLSYSGGETEDPVNRQPINANGDLGAISSAKDELYTWDGEVAKTSRRISWTHCQLKSLTSS